MSKLTAVETEYEGNASHYCLKKKQTQNLT